jgi:NAD(P)-dependent dehydrogenase (short-subunit alcohol dehydrogenase family)
MDSEGYSAAKGAAGSGDRSYRRVGYESALGLVQAGAEVLVTGRNREKGRTAVEAIRKSVPGAKVRFEMLDLANLASVREFAQRLRAEKRPVDLLVNNAGVMDLPETFIRWRLRLPTVSALVLTGLACSGFGERGR